MLECVVNCSEGADPQVLQQLRESCSPHLLDVHSDPDHHRSVFTLAGPRDDGAERGAHALTLAAFEVMSLEQHHGVHPRLGTVDVVPFVPLFSTASSFGRDRAWAVGAARRYAVWLERLGVPSFLYGDADPRGRSLPEIRKEAFRTRFPDFGPKQPHPKHGSVAVGARPPMVALNINYPGDAAESVRTMARAIRESGGGMRGVRALAFDLPSRGGSQLSMNIIDLAAAPVHRVIETADTLASDRGLSLGEIELVGLMPGPAFRDCPEEIRKRAKWTDRETIEGRLIARDAGAAES